MAYGKSGASAPPYGDRVETSGTARATQEAERGLRSRLGATKVYKAPAGTGSSSSMPTGRATADTVRRLGGNSGPKKFSPMKT